MSHYLVHLRDVPMIKKFVLGLLLLVALGLVGLNSIGITPAFIVYGPGVASGIGAKLLCSAEYVIGSERDQAFEDLVQYSPILSQISVRYDDAERAVTSSLQSMKTLTQASTTPTPPSRTPVSISIKKWVLSRRCSPSQPLAKSSSHPPCPLLLQP